jgi:hypothetical protein
MRRLFGLLYLCALAIPAAAETPPLLGEAFQKLIANENHWAYTRTTQWYDRVGRPENGLTIERYDPSQAPDLRWTLVQYEGRMPTDSDRAAWQRHNHWEVKRREKSLGDVLDLEHAAVLTETPDAVLFEVPIFKGASRRFPADKLIVTMQVDKTLHALVAFSVRPRTKIRIVGVVKIEDAEVDGRFDVVDDRYAPVFTWAHGSGQARILGLIRIGRGAEMRFTDFRRVTPFDERFSVKIGDLKALDF